MKPGLVTYLLPPILAWFVAQGIKTSLALRHRGVTTLRQAFFASGNMPSSHAALTSALTTIIGRIDGINSSTFAICISLTLIVLYDAVKVRRASGEQGLALRKLLEVSKFSKEPLPYHALGHKPIEVIAGLAIGIAVGLLVAFFVTI